MLSSPTLSAAAEALSERLLRAGQLTLWRELFLGDAQRSLQVARHARMVLLATDAPRHGWRAPELAMFAGRFAGMLDAVVGDDALMAFADAEHALHAALLLQKIGAECQVRAALTTGACEVASFEQEGRTRYLLLPADTGWRADTLQRVTPATVLVCAGAHAAMERLLGHALRDVLVVTEYDDAEQPEASIMLLPRATSFASTFAGLGSC